MKRIVQCAIACAPWCIVGCVSGDGGPAENDDQTDGSTTVPPVGTTTSTTETTTDVGETIGAGSSEESGVTTSGGTGSEEGAGSTTGVDECAPRELGTAVALEEPCASGNLPNATCMHLQVSCPDVPDLVVQIRIAEPDRPAVGTIVFGTGGGGTGFVEPPAPQGAPFELLDGLVAEGYRVVDRRWDSNETAGWQGGPGGMLALACRYATLLTWVGENVAQEDGAPLCAIGNSGGSSEISYALSHYGRSQILTQAIPTGGPPHARLDRGCGMVPTWQDECWEDWQTLGLDCPGTNPETACLKGGTASLIDAAYPELDAPCASRDEAEAERFHADSVMNDCAEYSFPSTRVDFIDGMADCTSAISNARPYWAAVIEAPGNNASQVFVEGAGHGVWSTSEGATVLMAALLAGCVD